VRKVVEHVTRGEFRKHSKSVDKRFDAVDKRFDAVDKRFDAVDKRLDAMDKRFDAMDKRFDGMDARFDAMDKRFDTSEQRMTEVLGRFVIEIDTSIARHIRASEERIRAEIRRVDDQYRDLPQRVARLEEHTGIKR
jgi:flagellar capping protein FliD